MIVQNSGKPAPFAFEMGFLRFSCAVVRVAGIGAALYLNSNSMMQAFAHDLLYTDIRIVGHRDQDCATSGISYRKPVCFLRSRIFPNDLANDYKNFLHRLLADLRIIRALQLRTKGEKRQFPKITLGKARYLANQFCQRIRHCGTKLRDANLLPI